MASSVEKRASQVTNLSLAARVAKSVDLQWIRLRRAQLQVDAQDVDSLPAELRFDTSVRQSFRWKEGASAIDVFMDYRLDIVNDSVGGAREAFLTAEFHLRYGLVDSELKFSAGELRWFADLNGTLNSWPYWRELTQTVLGRAGMGSLTLPLWRPSPVRVDADGTPLKDDPAE